jgi:hypothetical protein
MLEAFLDVQSGRLAEACGYSPVVVGDVLVLCDRLRWAATEAIRICPNMANEKDVVLS